MLLFSSTYFVFLVGIFVLYWPVARLRALSLAVLLFANYFFYIKWDLFYLALIPVASTADYLIALGLEKFQRTAIRRALVSLSILLNLGILVAFKYMPVVKSDWAWVFPLGISYYTFQALSYTIDVYRRDAKATSSLLGYLTAVSFFPTTLAGPITRPSNLIPQLNRNSPALAPADSSKALFLIGLGLMKKLLIADYLGDNLVNRVFDTPNLYSGFEVLVGVYGYAFQLYYDFSGYTDIAIGSALLLGLKLPANFQQPYLAENIADFWRRWHISLSNWLRDYLYFSLPGNRTHWQYWNLLATMLLGGLWHGASVNFLIWGGLHGAALAVTRAFQVWRGNPKPSPNPLRRFGRRFGTFHYVCLSWIFFRAAGLENAGQILERLSSFTFSTANLAPGFLAVFTLAAVAHFLPKRAYEVSLRAYTWSPAPLQALALALIVLAVQYVAATGAAPFIYTKF